MSHSTSCLSLIHILMCIRDRHTGADWPGGLVGDRQGPRAMKKREIYKFLPVLKTFSRLNIVRNKTSGFILVRFEVITPQPCLYTAYLVFTNGEKQSKLL